MYVPGTVEYDPGTFNAFFTPMEELQPNTIYTATMTQGVEDAAGNHLVSALSWTFVTRTTETSTTALTATIGKVVPGIKSNLTALLDVIDQDGTMISGLTRYHIRVQERVTGDFLWRTVPVSGATVGTTDKPTNPSPCSWTTARA